MERFDLEFQRARGHSGEITVRPAGELQRLLGEQVRPCVYRPGPRLAERLADMLEADPASLLLTNLCPEEVGLEGLHVGDHAHLTYEPAEYEDDWY